MKLEKISERMVVCIWIISAMIICWSYSTNLMSLLAVRYAPRPIQTIRDLLDNEKMSVIFTPNTALTDYIENIDSGLLREIVNLRSVGRYKDIHFTEFPKVLGTLVRRGDHVIATDTTDGTRLIANYFSQVGSCNFYMAREAFVPFVMGMIGQQGSPLVEALTHRIGSIVAGGMYRHWLDSNFANSSSCRHMPSRFTVREPLAIINIWGLFVLLVSGLSVAGMTFLLEMIFVTVVDQEPKEPTMKDMLSAIQALGVRVESLAADKKQIMSEINLLKSCRTGDLSSVKSSANVFSVVEDWCSSPESGERFGNDEESEFALEEAARVSPKGVPKWSMLLGMKQQLSSLMQSYQPAVDSAVGCQSSVIDPLSHRRPVVSGTDALSHRRSPNRSVQRQVEVDASRQSSAS
ncbi:uncharacterized protein [Palaemon carinicauda]|uniref:uncharacterized protein n=1 Tax=Palaemon carinicauda TaxID=392227 RepID=UPI0035B58192